MYGDSAGNYAWFATAHLYDLEGSPSTKQVLDTQRRVRHTGNKLSFDLNPQAINPPSGFVYSANNAPESDSLYIPGYFLPENRAGRIVDLLESEDRWNATKTEEMLLDVSSEIDRDMCRYMTGILNSNALDTDQKAWVKQLANWDGQYRLEQPEPGFFHQWVYALIRLGMEDEMGKERFNGFLETHLFKRSLKPLVENGESIWWDRIDTAEKENRDELVQRAFAEAWDLMNEHHGESSDWSWGDMHTLTHNHPLGTVPYLGKLWNVSAGPVEGSREVINNLMFDYLGEPSFRVKAGPSTRRIVDFSDPDNSRAVLPTGQSGNPFSPYYQDQKDLYVSGAYRPMLMDSVRIRENEKGHIRLLPSGK
jgi:penicillin amidase